MGSSTWLRYSRLSLPARFAVALICVEEFCKSAGLNHPDLDAFLAHGWELPLIESFPKWESEVGVLCSVGLGDSFPSEWISRLDAAGIPEATFRKLLDHTVEIIFGSAYAASDDQGSLRHLDEVLRIAQEAGVSVPLAGRFSQSRFADRGGWGRRLTAEERDQWRFGIG